MTRPPNVSLFAALAAVILTGCKAVDNPQVPATPPAGSNVPSPFRLSDRPVLDLGGEGASAKTEFQSPYALHRMKDGRVIVLEARGREIRVFDSTGQFLKVIARGGNGPGEIPR